MVFVMTEKKKGEKSYWKEYLASLPRLDEFNDMPTTLARFGDVLFPPATLSNDVSVLH